MTPIELNEWGLAVWQHKENKNLFVSRAYNWCDRVIVLDETEGRRVINDTQFSTFDFTDWIPVTVEEFKRLNRILRTYTNGGATMNEDKSEEQLKRFDQEPKMLAKVECGFNKWAIGVDANYIVKVKKLYKGELTCRSLMK